MAGDRLARVAVWGGVGAFIAHEYANSAQNSPLGATLGLGAGVLFSGAGLRVANYLEGSLFGDASRNVRGCGALVLPAAVYVASNRNGSVPYTLGSYVGAMEDEVVGVAKHVGYVASSVEHNDLGAVVAMHQDVPVAINPFLVAGALMTGYGALRLAGRSLKAVGGAMRRSSSDSR